MSKLFKSKFLLGVLAMIVMFAVTTSVFAADGSVTMTLKKGMKNVQVKYLQQTLNEKGFTVATSGAGSVGKESTYFGPATVAAVKAFQVANNLVADGIFGAKGRAALAGTVSNPGNPNPPVVSGPVSVMLATSNPASGNVLESQALADLAHFTFTGSGTVSQITLQRTGLSVSADVTNVYLFDGNQRLTDGASVNTSGAVVFNNVNLSVNGSRTVSVKVDMAASTSSVTLGMTLTGYMTVGATTASSANLAGNLFYVNNAPSGMTSASSLTAGTTLVPTANVNAGAVGYTVWSNSLSVNGRVGLLKGLNLHYIGSAPVDSLANAKLYLDGSPVGTTATVNSNGYLFFDLGAGVNLSVSSHTLDVRADVVKGSNRNFQLSLQNASDLMILDSQIGININTTNAVTNGVAGTITVNPGSVTVSVDPTFNSVTTVTGGATNVVVARYKFQAYGEDMKITSLTATPTIASGTPATTSMNNVALYANGGQIGSSQNYTGTPLVYSLGSSLIINAGTTTIVEVKADTINATPANYTAGNLTVNLKGSTSNAQGMSSQNLTTAPSTTGITSGTLTIGAATATVAKSSSLNDKNIISNTAKTKIGSFVVQSGSTEGVRVTNLQVGLTFGAAAATYASGTINAVASNSITFSSTVNIAVGDVLTIEAGATDAVGTVTSITSGTVAVVNFSVAGSTTGTPSAVTGTSGPMTITNISNLYTSDDTVNVVGNPQASNNFSVNYTIAPSTTKTIDVYADLGGLNAGTVNTTLKISAVGATTNVALSTGNGIATALDGQLMTVAAGSVATPTLTTASMVSQYVAGGSSPALATYNFVATNGDATITQLKFTVATTATAINHVCVGSVCADVIGGVADVAGLNIVVPSGYAGKDVLVTPTFNAVGIGQQTSNVAATMNLTYIKYTVGNTTTVATPTVTGNAMRLVASYPTVAMNTATRTGLSNTLVKLADVTVTANTAGPIKLKELPIITTSTGVATIASGTNNIVVKDSSGNSLVSAYSITNATFAVAANGSSADVAIVFGTSYNIPAGTSVTFGIYATAATVSGAVNTTSLSTKLGAVGGFKWDDVNGNVTGILGSSGPILNYPTDGSVITN